MGGMGSGRRNQSGKDTTEGARPLDIRKLQRAGVLIPGRLFGWQWTVYDRPVADIQIRVEADRVVLIYRHRLSGDSEWQDVQQPVYLAHTTCTYGGKRPWWLCPNCGRRVAVLYGPGKLYACRHCYRLAYSSQRENLDDRATRRADKIRDRLEWEPGILNGHGIKPKGMHSRTYQRLIIKHDAHVGISLNIMQQRMRMIEARFGGIGDDLNLFRKIEG